jgi:hypothetical protein
MSIVLGDINHGLKHKNREGYPRDPADEADDVKDREYDEYNGCAVPVSRKVYNRCANAEGNL